MKRVLQWNHLVFADKYNLEGKVLSLPFMTDDPILLVSFAVPVPAEAHWITGFGITIPFLFLMMSFRWFPEHLPFTPLGYLFVSSDASGTFFYKSDSSSDFFFISVGKNTPRYCSLSLSTWDFLAFWMWDARAPYLFW